MNRQPHRIVPALLATTLALSLLSAPALAISTQALEHYNRAKQMEQAENYDMAEKHLRTAIGLDPYDALSYLKLANLMWKRGNHQETIALFQKALELSPQDAMIHLSLAELYEGRNDLIKALYHYDQLIFKRPAYTYGHLGRARILARLKKTDEAVKAYDLFLQTYPEHFDARREKAALHLKEEQFDQAAKDFGSLKNLDRSKFSDDLAYAYSLNEAGKAQEALEVLRQIENPSPLVFEQMGQSLEKLNRPTEAYHAYQRALSMAPEQKFNLYLKMADIALAQGKVEKTRFALESYLVYDPDNVKIQKGLADLYLKEKLYPQAAQTYERILSRLSDIDPIKPEIQKNLGYAYQMENRQDKAIEVYEAISQNGKADFQTRSNLALAYHQQKHYNQALALYRDLLTEKPESAAIRKDLATVQLALAHQHFEKRNFHQAKALFQEAYLLQASKKHEAEALLGLANSQQALGNNAFAYETYEKVLAQEPDNVNARLSKARLDLKQQNHMAALENLRWIANHHPDNLDAYQLLASTHEHLGDYGQALINYQKALAIQPNEPRLLLSYGKVLHQVGDLDKAQEVYEVARMQSPKKRDDPLQPGRALQPEEPA